MISKDRKVKVLHTENSMGYTGAFKALLDFCIFSKDEIDSVWVIKKGSLCKKKLEEKGIRVYEIPFMELSKNPLNLLLYLPYLIVNSYKLKVIASIEKIDILHSNDLYNLSNYLVKYIFRVNKPLVTHVRMMPKSFPLILYKFWRAINVRCSDKLVAVSHAVKTAYGNPKNMTVVYDVQKITEHYPEYKSKVDRNEAFKFVYLSNYIEGKGQDYALAAFNNLVKLNPNVTLTFVGGDLGKNKNLHFKNKLKERVLTLGLKDKVSFEDFAEDVELKLKMYNASLNFSISESFSMVSFESLMYGVPLISSDCGGPSELFKHKHSGWLVKNESVEEMTEAMYQYSTNPDLVNTISENSKKYIQEIILNNNNYEKLKELFLK